jgi:hypothetical protein
VLKASKGSLSLGGAVYHPEGHRYIGNICTVKIEKKEINSVLIIEFTEKRWYPWCYLPP